MTVSVLMSPNASDKDIKVLSTFLKTTEGIKGIEYISKEEALEEISKELGEDPQDFLGWNPLAPAFELTLKAEISADKVEADKIVANIEKHDLVQKIIYKRDLLEKINDNIRVLSLAMTAIAGLLLLVSFALISNTIKLMIYARRFSIYTMRLVGATPGFICRPFIAQNLINGAIAAVIALGLLAWGAYYLASLYPIMGSLLTWQNAIVLCGAVILFGVLISVWSAAVTVNKYMRMDMNKLYRI
ncbi:ABC transporter permease [Porphyromonas sp.]|uniref:cell division protein FtsX n=1 Tax=Porphyromonas sp. TaxID=1924944 RepID=UPI0026DCA65B|nr:permease-like cell division protein FtsX [Porphyromonas sp.]MDO4770276.1 permease-like cell division protein FtsX [Porphyromonas sp.]